MDPRNVLPVFSYQKTDSAKIYLTMKPLTRMFKTHQDSPRPMKYECYRKTCLKNIKRENKPT